MSMFDFVRRLDLRKASLTRLLKRFRSTEDPKRAGTVIPSRTATRSVHIHCAEHPSAEKTFPFLPKKTNVSRRKSLFSLGKVTLLFIIKETYARAILTRPCCLRRLKIFLP